MQWSQEQESYIEEVINWTQQWWACILEKKAKCVLLRSLCNQASHCSLWICVHWNIGSGSHWTSPSHPHNLSAEYSFSPSTWHNAQSQCWPFISFSPLLTSLFPDFIITGHQSIQQIDYELWPQRALGSNFRSFTYWLGERLAQKKSTAG